MNYISENRCPYCGLSNDCEHRAWFERSADDRARAREVAEEAHRFRLVSIKKVPRSGSTMNEIWGDEIWRGPTASAVPP